MSTSECKECGANKHSYRRKCLGCAVRLVKSARPSRKQQETMLAYIVAYGDFTKEQVIEAVKNDPDTATS